MLNLWVPDYKLLHLIHGSLVSLIEYIVINISILFEVFTVQLIHFYNTNPPKSTPTYKLFFVVLLD
jgi:hypothetical protein